MSSSGKKGILQYGFYSLLVFFPIAGILKWQAAPPTLVFVASCLAIIPLAGLMGEATESLSEKLGAGVGGLLNATFGNAAELIIAAMALQRGLHDVVKASITGSIIGNILLVFGMSVLLGGMKFETQRFNRVSAGLGSTLLTLSSVGLLVPALFHWVVQSNLVTGHIDRAREANLELNLSLEIAAVLFLVYGLSLFFSLKTHKNLLQAVGVERPSKGKAHGHWNSKKALLVLSLATVATAISSEFLVSSVEATAKTWGLTEVFVGVIVVAIIGNAAEHSTAVWTAMRNNMDLSFNIAVGSSIQVALFVAPVLVFLSYGFGQPLDLHFSLFEVMAVTIAVSVVNLVAQDGESHWMEGVLLVAVYLILAIAFYFLPA
jgi:Ca2+:H+ antiporter